MRKAVGLATASLHLQLRKFAPVPEPGHREVSTCYFGVAKSTQGDGGYAERPCPHGMRSSAIWGLPFGINMAQRTGRCSMKVRTILLSSISILIVSIAAFAAEIPLVASSLVPAATGKLSYEHDRNGNVKLAIQTKNLAAPDQLTPAKDVYVVWIEPAISSRRRRESLRLTTISRAASERRRRTKFSTW